MLCCDLSFLARCPNDCQGNGNCNETDWTCDCKEVRGGEDCSEVKYTYCEEINSVDFNHTSRKDACLDLHSFLGCGYCGGSYDTCLDGNRAGPVFDSCMWWFYDGWWSMLLKFHFFFRSRGLPFRN